MPDTLLKVQRMRRLIVLALLIFLPSLTAAAEADTQANVPLELTFTAQREHADPFNQVALDVIFKEPDGTARKVPAFWAGGVKWKVRYASPQVGSHSWRSETSDPQDAGLHGMSGKVEITPYRGENPLYAHGPIRIAEDKRHFEHADGTPFFWLGDTWWMGLCHRLHYPDEFQKLTADRKEKGFNVIQIVAGLYPDMPPFDPRGANEAGFPWEKDYTRIRPEYFDAADARLMHLVDQGMSPCVVGAWGYFMPWMGVEKTKAHWRYLIARYGAWPVIWCAAGEANLPWYKAKGFPYDDREQVHGWTQILSYIRASDPWRRPLTIHPTAINKYTARHATDDTALLDFDMLQTPHGQREVVGITSGAMRESYQAQPTMPVLDGEAAYEMLSDSLPTAWTRASFWLCMTGGAAGHTYGANGIWQVNRRGQPHGASPHGGSYGVIAWDDAMRLPGSSQMAIGKKFFTSLPWTRLKPMPDSAAWEGSSETVPLGDWIWYPEGKPHADAPVAARYFRRVFDLPDKADVRRAALRVAADDKFTVWINGRELGSGADWKAPNNFDAAAALKPGRNVLAVRGENVSSNVTQNPAGLTVGLDIELAGGVRSSIRSDAAWRAEQTAPVGWQGPEYDDAKWPAAVVAQTFGGLPWGRIGEAQPAGGIAPQVCGIGDKLRVIYALDPRSVLVRELQAGAKYRLTVLDPVSGDRGTPTEITADGQGSCHIPPPGNGHDWVALLEKL